MTTWTECECGCKTDGAGHWEYCAQHGPPCFCRYEVTPVMCPKHGVVRG